MSDQQPQQPQQPERTRRRIQSVRIALDNGRSAVFLGPFALSAYSGRQARKVHNQAMELSRLNADRKAIATHLSELIDSDQMKRAGISLDQPLPFRVFRLACWANELDEDCGRRAYE